MHYLDGAFPIENGLAKWAIPPRLGPPYLPMAKQLFRHIAVQTSSNRRRNLIADPCADRPAGLSSKKDWLCPRKWLMLFSLKFQRNNQKNASTMDSAKGKTGEKGCLFTVPHTMTEPFGKAVLGKAIGKGGLDFGEKRGKVWGAASPFLQKRSPQ